MIAKLTVNHRGGDVFDVSQEPSDRCVLWGELIKEKERRFLLKSLREEQICFSIRDTFQIYLRTVWRPESATVKGMIHRKGRFAMLLHDTTGRLTTSWTWLKLVQPLYQMGLSVILVDLPGLGKSSINNALTLHPSVWQGHEGHILCHILDELKVMRCHVVACGNSCSALIRMLKLSPHQLEKEHILHNPVLDYNNLFRDKVVPAPGTGPGWRDILRAEQQTELETFLVNHEVRILATFDQAEYGRTRETHESFLMASRKNMVLSKLLQPLEVTKEDVCEAQIGAKVPVSFLFLRKEMRERFTEALQHVSAGTLMASCTAASFTATGNSLQALNAQSSPQASPLPAAALRPPSQQGARTGGLAASKSAGFLQGTPAAWANGDSPKHGLVRSPPSPGWVVEPPRSAQSLRTEDTSGMLSAGWTPPTSALSQTPSQSAFTLKALEGIPHSKASTETPWYHAAFAPGSFSPGSDWAVSTSNVSTLREQRAYSSEASKRESLTRLVSDPHDQRRHLLSKLPARTRRNIRAMQPEMNLNLADPEPASQQEEKYQITQAIKKSKQTFTDEMQVRARGSRTFNF